MSLLELLTKHGIAVEEAKAKGLEQDFMKEYKPVSELETLTAELNGAKTQLAAANGQIEKFQGMDIEAVRKEAEQWRQKAREAEEAGKKEVEGLKFGYALEAALAKEKAKDPVLVRRLLDTEKLKYVDGNIIGLQEQIDSLKANQCGAGLFESAAQQPPQFTAPLNGGGKPPETIPFHFAGVREQPKQ